MKPDKPEMSTRNEQNDFLVNCTWHTKKSIHIQTLMIIDWGRSI